jgi:hypothetical protein
VYSEQAKALQEVTTHEFYEFLYAPLFGIFLAIFYIGSEKDRMTRTELKLHRNNPNYQLIRTIFKLASVMVLTAITTIPTVWFISVLNISDQLNTMSLQFFSDFSRYGTLIIDIDFLIITLGATLIPYLIYFYLEAKWESGNLAFQNWVSILGLLEPVFSLIFGIWLLKEEFMPFAFIIILILTAAAIIMRYIDETENKIIAFILIKEKVINTHEHFKKLFELKDCVSIHSVIGANDFIMEVKLSSQKRFYKLIKQKIPDITGKNLEELEVLFVNKTFFEKSK